MTRSTQTIPSRLPQRWPLPALFASGVGIACGDKGRGTRPEDRVPAQIIISPDSALLASIGETRRFSAVMLNQAGAPIEGETVTWGSTDSVIVRPSSDGEFMAVGNGRSRVRARVAFPLEATAPVVVITGVPEDNVITSVRGVSPREQLFTMAHDGSDVLRVTFAGGALIDPVSHCDWDPSWGRAVFMGRNDPCFVNADGSGKQQIPSAADGFESPAQWFPNGRTLVLARDDQIWLADADGGNKRVIAADRVL